MSEDDKLIAKDIRATLSTLNDQLKIAAKAGLFVEIERLSGYEYDCPAPLIICMVRIERRSKL